MNPCSCVIYCRTGRHSTVLSMFMETRNLQCEDRPSSHLFLCTCAPLCWQWVLDVRTPQCKYVTHSLKIDMECKLNSAWIQEVLDGTNPWKECTANFDEPRQISHGSPSFRCVRVPGYTWSLTTLQSQSINQGNVCESRCLT